jgi:hypothetical protein
MIKRVFIVFAIIFLLLPPLVAYADVVYGNDFAMQHKTTPLNRAFCANGMDGYVSAKEAPNSKTEEYKYENGRIIWISATYKHKGEYWGITPEGHGPVQIFC